MAHYKTMYDESDFLFAHDLGGKAHTVRIAKVEAGKVVGDKGKASKKPIVYFVGKKKKLALNKTNGKTISRLYGSDTSGWVGKEIEIYPTVTQFGGEEVDCIRIKSRVPKPGEPQRSEPEPDVAEQDDEGDANEVGA